MGAPAIRPVTTPTSVLACQVQTDKKHAGIHVDTHPLSYAHTYSHPSDLGFPKASGISRQWYLMLCYKYLRLSERRIHRRMSEQDSQSVEERKRVGCCGRNLLYGLSAPLWGASRKCISPKRKSLKPWEIIKQANMAGSIALWSRALSGPGFASVGTAVRLCKHSTPTEPFYCSLYSVHQFINSCVAGLSGSY